MALSVLCGTCGPANASGTILLSLTHLILKDMNLEKCKSHVLISGSAMILVGLIVGALVPVFPFPRLAVGAHIQFVTNGILFIVQSLVLHSFQPRFGKFSSWITISAAFLTWLMAASEVLNSFWGTLETLPIAGRQAGATGGTAIQEAVVKLPHGLAALSLIISWGFTINGLLKRAD